MKCDDIRLLLQNYMDHELTEEMAERVERHVLTCAGCADELSSLRQTLGLLKESDIATLSADAADRILARVLAEVMPDSTLDELPFAGRGGPSLEELGQLRLLMLPTREPARRLS